MIVSQAVAERVAARLPQAMSLRDLGSLRLRDLGSAAAGDDAAFDGAWQEGRAVTLERAIALTRDDWGAWN